MIMDADLRNARVKCCYSTHEGANIVVNLFRDSKQVNKTPVYARLDMIRGHFPDSARLHIMSRGLFEWSYCNNGNVSLNTFD